ncbi:MAG: Dihydrolipoamide acetyltransferase [Myxococcales bacterium]|nr:Dihydrolipoamide acetyltransferase [Myxococcales bacterium]
MRTTFVVAAAALLLPIRVYAGPDDQKTTAANAPKSATTTTAPATGTAAPGAPPSAPAPAATPAPAQPDSLQGAPATSQGSYTIRLHDLERRVNELKEQIFRSKARLNLLKETVLHGVIAGARAIITQRNEMGSMYTPIRYVYALDGQEIYSKVDESGKLADQKEIEVFNGSITPGNHTLSVQMVYQGNGYGVFSYLKGYKFTAKSSRTFTAPEGKQLQMKVVGFEKGNPVTTDPKDRPAVDFRESLVADKDTLPKSSAPAKK